MYLTTPYSAVVSAGLAVVGALEELAAKVYDSEHRVDHSTLEVPWPGRELPVEI